MCRSRCAKTRLRAFSSPGGAADATIRHVIQRKDLQRLGDMPASVNPSIVSAKGLAIRIMDHVDEPAVVTILR